MLDVSGHRHVMFPAFGGIDAAMVGRGRGVQPFLNRPEKKLMKL